MSGWVVGFVVVLLFLVVLILGAAIYSRLMFLRVQDAILRQHILNSQKKEEGE